MPPLDLTLLEKVRHHPSGKITARCPACAEEGGDRTGNHLAIFTDDRYACAARPGDGSHRSRIMALTGIRSAPDPERQRKWEQRRNEETIRKSTAVRLVKNATRKRLALIQQFPWHPAAARCDNPQRPDDERMETCPRHFLASLFPSHALLWTGEVHESGATEHARRWRTCREWQSAEDDIGPMTTPAVWQPGTISRSAANVLATPYTVLDFDGFDGVRPTTPQELERHIHHSLSLVRWLREKMHWQLAAIVTTGGKSIHAWFHSPAPEVLASLSPIANSLGIDAGLIGRPEHPCRLPGQRHGKTGRISRVLWLSNPPPPR